MSKHTPGPWTAIDTSWEQSVISDASGRCVAIVYLDGNVQEETQDELEPIKNANARLIAAAPTMLEALEAIADFAPGYGDVCEIIAQRARAAIAKATGDDDASQV